jgi:hypothetical protein
MSSLPTIRIVIFKVVGHGVFGRDFDPGRDDFREQRAGEGGGRDSDEECVEDGAAYIGVVGIDGEKCGGVRGNKSVINRESGYEGQCHADQRDARAAGDGECDWNEKDEADLKERRESYDQADAHHGPGDTFFAKDADKREGDGVGSSGLSHHFAEHGSEGHDNGDVAEHVANAHFEGVDGICHGHSGDDGEGK